MFRSQLLTPKTSEAMADERLRNFVKNGYLEVWLSGKHSLFFPPRHFLRFLPFYASYRCYTHYRPLTSIIWDVCHATESLYNYKRQNSSKCEVKVTFSPSFPGSVNPYISNTFYLKKSIICTKILKTQELLGTILRTLMIYYSLVQGY